MGKQKSAAAIIKKDRDKDTRIKPFDLVKKKKTTLAYYVQKVKEFFFPDRMVLIQMEYANGFHDSFLVVGTDSGFRLHGRKYLFDDKEKYYHLTARYWCYDYHENFALPLRRKIPVNEIKATIEQEEGIEYEYAVNPSSLMRFITAKIAEGIMQGQDIPELIRRIFLILVILLILVAGHVLLFAYKTGMFQQIKGIV